MTAQENSGLVNVCIFVVLVYHKVWFTASNVVTAPNNDLIFLKRLAENATIDKHGKNYKVAFKKFVNHLWYLSEELIALAFFDENVSADCKRKMCQAIKSRSALMDDRKKRKVGINDAKFIQDSTLDSFVTENTMKFFEILKIDSSFLNTDSTTWKSRDDFVAASKIVKCLHARNDVAERSVSLVSEYNDLLTKDEASKENLS